MRFQIAFAVVAGTFLGTLLIHPAIAQTQATTTINGPLSDPSDAVIPGATIVAQPMGATDKPITTHSGEDGRFSLELAQAAIR
jgi:hypothetical protein